MHDTSYRCRFLFVPLSVPDYREESYDTSSREERRRRRRGGDDDYSGSVEEDVSRQTFCFGQTESDRSLYDDLIICCRVPVLEEADVVEMR